MKEEVGESGARVGLPEEEPQGNGSGKIELIPEPEDGSISQNFLEIKEADVGNDTPMLTPDKLKPEFENSQEMDNEAKYSEEKVCLDHQESSSSPVITQESMECRSFMESDDYSAADNVSDMSTSVKNYLTVDDEGAAPQFEDKKEILRKESEDVVMEIAERLSQLRSIGKTAESARKYILESDTSTEDLDSNDHMSELLGPKRLDFEVIDFDQFGAQPPDLPLNDISTKMHHHGGIISSFHSGKAKAKKPESHVNARNGFDQEVAAEMKGLHDSPVKKSTPEKKHLRRERGAGAALDLPAGHVIPRLCNMGHVEEGGRGQEVTDTHLISGRTGCSKPRLPDSTKPKKLSEAASGSPIRRSKSTMPDLKGSPVHEETRKRTEDHKRLEEYCNRVDLSTAHLERQSRMQEEVNRELENERGERLKSEAKLIMLCEMLPSVEENLKSLCDQMLVMEAQLQEQVGLRNKLEEALERGRQVVKLADQVDLRNKLEQEREERMRLAVKLAEQVELRNKLLEQERQERLHLAAKLENRVESRDDLLDQKSQGRMHLASKLEDQVHFWKKLGEALEQERQERMHLAAKQEVKVNKLEGSLERVLQERAHLATKLEEQNKGLEQERQERIAQLDGLRNRLEAKEREQCEEQIRELACTLEQERDERSTGSMALREIEEKLVDLNNQIESLTSQLKEQTRLREELQIQLREELQIQLREELQIQLDQGLKMHEELAHKFEEGVKNETNLKGLQDQVLVLATQLQEQIELRKELEERLERMPSAVVATESLSIQEKSVFAKMLDEQKELLANQAKEAEMLKSATEKKVGLLNHQVQNLEMLSEIVETMENVQSLKERATRQTVWTIFQALWLVMGLMSFIFSCRNPLMSSLHPT